MDQLHVLSLDHGPPVYVHSLFLPPARADHPGRRHAVRGIDARFRRTHWPSSGDSFVSQSVCEVCACSSRSSPSFSPTRPSRSTIASCFGTRVCAMRPPAGCWRNVRELRTSKQRTNTFCRLVSNGAFRKRPGHLLLDFDAHLRHVGARRGWESQAVEKKVHISALSKQHYLSVPLPSPLVRQNGLECARRRVSR